MVDAESIQHVDEPLLREFLRGGVSATRQIERWARAVARNHGIDPGDQEDVVQDTLMGVLHSAGKPGFALRKGMREFVRRIASYRSIDVIRARMRSRETLEAEGAATEKETAVREPAPPLPRAVRWAVQQVGTRCRDLIRLHLHEGYTLKEIASRWGLADSTVGVHWLNCRKKLRELVTSYVPSTGG